MKSRPPNDDFTVKDVNYRNIRISSQHLALQRNTLPQLGENGRKNGFSVQNKVLYSFSILFIMDCFRHQ